MRPCVLAVLALFYSYASRAQTAAPAAEDASPASYTRQDSLRGSLRPERTGYDVTFYDLNVAVNPATRTIDGTNTIRYRVKQPFSRMQIDLFANLEIGAITQNGKPLEFQREGNAVFVTMGGPQPVGKVQEIRVVYRGKPVEAKSPPWDGGFSWSKDSTGRDWVGVSCEGLGASSWWPCKDHLSDEPDSMRMTFRVPNGLMCVSNGRLVGKREAGAGQTEFTWAVSYPINSYNVTFNLGDYVRIQDQYRSRDFKFLDLNYYVLRYNEAKAVSHFAQVKGMLDCYEWHFGHFPFWRDGYALVETPYWGMEHQSAIAYGNNYKNNPFGFDFIIIHESGHEYFGNSLSCADPAEMWIHEAFTTYMESLYVESTEGYEKAVKYLMTQKKLIKSQFPMVGPAGVNFEPKDNDIYYKGAWMLHTLRNVVDNDDVWFIALRKLALQKKHSIVSTAEIVDILSRETKMDLKPIFDQFLNYAKPPIIEYQLTEKGDDLEIRHRWIAEAPGFDMPLKFRFAFGPWHTLRPTREWQTTTVRRTKGWFSLAYELQWFGTRQLLEGDTPTQN
ncbi:M1 family metallopeptidase [Larkinella soli]|uniref:M1 family metallopeptidase n=1 Tax=Larkinella soli TaxID=1770527 RepID=UPI0013E375FC|nr:M1 family metallopeptidase [Larkinella soli]